MRTSKGRVWISVAMAAAKERQENEDVNPEY